MLASSNTFNRDRIWLTDHGIVSNHCSKGGPLASFSEGTDMVRDEMYAAGAWQ